LVTCCIENSLIVALEGAQFQYTKIAGTDFSFSRVGVLKSFDKDCELSKYSNKLTSDHPKTTFKENSYFPNRSDGLIPIWWSKIKMIPKEVELLWNNLKWRDTYETKNIQPLVLYEL